MCLVEEEINHVKNTVENGFKELRELINNKNEATQGPPALPMPEGPSYSQVTSKSTSSVIVIKKTKNGPSADLAKVRQAAISTSAAISKAYQNNAGDTVVVLENQSSKEAMLPELQKEMKNYSVVNVKERQPTISIINVDQEYEKDEFLTLVKQQNVSRLGSLELNENNFQVLFTKKQFKNPNLFKVVVRVSSDIRQAIERSGDHLNIGLTSCAVFDEFFVRRCNRCQGFNHWKDACSKDAPVICGRCGKNHDTRECESTVAKCVNCVRGGFSETDHVTSSPSCHAYIDAQKRLHNTINYITRITQKTSNDQAGKMYFMEPTVIVQ